MKKDLRVQKEVILTNLRQASGRLRAVVGSMSQANHCPWSALLPESGVLAPVLTGFYEPRANFLLKAYIWRFLPLNQSNDIYP